MKNRLLNLFGVRNSYLEYKQTRQIKATKVGEHHPANEVFIALVKMKGGQL